MNFIARLQQRDIAKLPDAPLLVLCIGGADAAAVDQLRAHNPAFHIIESQEDFLNEMANAGETMRSFDPLVGHRHSQAETSSDHPWFGAERTAPDPMTHSLAVGAALHLCCEETRPVFVCRQIFWALQDCAALVDFLLGWSPRARLLLITGPPETCALSLADETQWRHEAAENAVEAMNDVFVQLAALYRDRCLIWTLPETLPDTLPDAVCEFLAEQDGAAG